MLSPLPVNVRKCKTCPFRKGGWQGLEGFLTDRALTTGTPICHATGPGALTKRIAKESRACRGARDAQLQFFFRLGFIAAPSDQAWKAKVDEINSHHARKSKRTNRR